MNRFTAIFWIIILVFLSICSLIGCSKEANSIKPIEEKKYSTIVTITGYGNYVYHLGTYSESGHCDTITIISKYAAAGDYLECYAVGDSTNSTMCIESKRENAASSKQCVYGVFKIGVAYQF